MITKSQMRIIMGSGALCLACLVGTVSVLVKKDRLATETPVVDALVGRIVTVKGKYGLIPYAQLIFNREDAGGVLVHCDVPQVPVRGYGLNTGDTIKVAPYKSSCGDPLIICATCIAPTQGLALGLLAATIVFGAIFVFMTRRVTRYQKGQQAS